MPTPTIPIVSGTSLLDLPVEIRLLIYEHLYTPAKVVLDAGNPSSIQSCLIPHAAETRRRRPGRSSQLLRVCRMILLEARLVLYANTTFHIMTHTFAGSLPSSLSNGHPIARYAKHVVWEMSCDILKKYYPEESTFRQGDLAMLDTLEVVAKVDTWKGSFCGEDCDREGFVRGRKGMLEYGKLLLGQFLPDGASSTQLVEDQRHLGQGEVRLRLEKGGGRLGSMVRRFQCNITPCTR